MATHLYGLQSACKHCKLGDRKMFWACCTPERECLWVTEDVTFARTRCIEQNSVVRFRLMKRPPGCIMRCYGDALLHIFFQMLRYDQLQASASVCRSVVGHQRSTFLEKGSEYQCLAPRGCTHVQDPLVALDSQCCSSYDRRLIKVVGFDQILAEGYRLLLNEEGLFEGFPPFLVYLRVVGIKKHRSLYLILAFCHGVTVPTFGSLVNLLGICYAQPWHILLLS
ncbi:hypothetical protein SDC9_98104 [bioreactor metagenome]|uniref:Uncharacterized protein n=1 Tax=bioreactor metagenome TaxID=1076179 RepID=A0A645AEH5_9ZZZZ